MMTRSWVNGTPYLHTALDDLESFLLVLLFTVLHIAEKRLEMTIEERGWFKTLQSRDYELLQLKGNILMRLKMFKRRSPESLSRPISLFADLCISWWEVWDEYVVVRYTGENPPAERCFEAFKEYMSAGLDCLEGLRGKSWGEGGAD